MSDVNAIINIDINSSSALVNLKRLESQIDQFNRSVASSNATAAAAQQSLNKALLDGINNTGLFTSKITPVESSMIRFSRSLDEGKLSLGEYAKTAGSQLPGLSRVFRKEFDTIEQVATSRVKSMQTQYLALGKTVDGVTKAIASTPTGLAKGMATDLAMTQQRQQIFNKLLDDGSTKLLNWGKNTQWAGRQLMVGFSLPLAAFGAAASKTFMEIDKATISLKRVYGDLSTTKAELDSNVEAVKGLGKEYTKYGITLAQTIDLSARAAATGATNEQLMAATEQTLRFATLGQMDYNQALDTTISLQTAFAISNEDLGKTVDYLNAVENQTILTMEDMSLAIPRVATVVKGLGGSVEDLAVMMTAMREGGVSAENAANGLKSGLASLINPTDRASESLNKMGINLNSIVTQNKGDLMGIVTEFGMAINKLDEFSRQQVLEQVFGKYQYARMSALFTNITKDAGQAARAMDIAGMSATDLAKISEKELGQISESTSVKFQAAMEQLKISIAPIGEAFLKGITPVVNMVSKIAEAFNNLPDGVKNSIAVITAVVAGLGPVFLMTIGLLGNGLANLIKGFQFVRKTLAGIKGDASAFTWLAQGELEAVTASKALENGTTTLTDKLLLQRGAVSSLTAEYQRFASAAGLAGASMGRMGGPQPAPTGRGGRPLPTPRKFATGGIVPGTGNGDTIPALLTPGESVITKKATQKYAPILQQMNDGTLPGFAGGVTGIGRFLGRRTQFAHATGGRSLGGDEALRLLSPAERQLYQSSGSQKVNATALSGLTIGVSDLENQALRVGVGKGLNPKEFSQRILDEALTPDLFKKLSLPKGTRTDFRKTLSEEIEKIKKDPMFDDDLAKAFTRAERRMVVKLKDKKELKDEFISSIASSRKDAFTRLKFNIPEDAPRVNNVAAARSEAAKSGLPTPTEPFYYYHANQRKASALVRMPDGRIVGVQTDATRKVNPIKLAGGRISIGEALKSWQTSSRSVRENPEMLGTLMSAMRPLQSRTNLTRGTTLGLSRGSEFDPADERIIMDALRSGNIDSVIGREVSMRGPISYTAGSTSSAINAMRQNTDVNRIEDLKSQHAQARQSHAARLKRIEGLKKKIATGRGPVSTWEAQLKELEGFSSMYAAGQKTKGREIKSLTSRGYEDLLIKQSFPPGSPMIDVNQANPSGTFMGKDVSRENEFLSGGSRVKIKGVTTDPKTGLKTLQLETIPDAAMPTPKDIKAVSNYPGTRGKSGQEIRADIEQRKALISIMDPQRLLTEALKPEVGGYELSRIVQAVMEKATDPKEKRTILKKIANSRGQEIGTNAWGGYNEEFGYATRGAADSATWRQVWNALKNEGTYIPWKKATGPQVQSRNYGGPIVPGTGSSDTVPAMLTPGEFVINKKATQQNLGLLHAINNGQSVKRNKGGMIDGVQYFEDGGGVQSSRGGYSYRGKENISQHVATIIDPAYRAIKERELEAARRGAVAAEEMAKSLGATSGQLLNIAQIDRAHTVGGVDKSNPEDWTPDKWMPQIGAENQLSTILAQSDTNRAAYLDHLKKIGATESEISSITHKVTKNIGLTSSELQVQSRVLQSMFSNSQDMARMSPSFELFARSTVASAQARAQAIPSPSQIIPGQRSFMEQGMISGGITEDSVLIQQEKRQSESRRAIESSRKARLAKETRAVSSRGVAPQAAAITALKNIRAKDQEDAIRINEELDALQEQVDVPEIDGSEDSRKRDRGIRRAKIGRGAQMGGGAMMMASMAPMMMADQGGNVMGMNAGAVTGGLMGAGILAEFAPMLMKLPVPILAVGAAAAGVAIGLKVLDSNLENSAKAAADFGANVGVTANSLNNVSKMFGVSTPSQRKAQLQLGFTAQEQEQASQFQPMIESESGQKFLKELKDATSTDRFKKLSDYIRSGIAAGVMDEQTGILFAKTISSALNDAVLGSTVLADLRKNKQSVGSEALVQLAKKRESSVANKDLNTYGDIGASIQIIQDYSNAVALANEEFVSGTISYQKYIEISKMASESQNIYNKKLEESLKTSDLLSEDRGLSIFNDQLAKILSPEQMDAMKKATERSYIETVTTGQKGQELEVKRKAALGSAIAGGMDADIAISTMQAIRDQPESNLSKTFEKYSEKKNALELTIFSENADVIGTTLKLTQNLTNQFKELGLSFLDAGGSLSEFQSFITNLPESVRGSQIQLLSNMKGEALQRAVSGGSAIVGAYGQEEAAKILQSKAYTQAQASVTGTTYTTGQGEVSTASPQNIKAFADIQKSFVDMQTAVGTENALKINVAVDSLQNGKTIDTNKWIQDSKQLTDSAKNIQDNLPSEIASKINIDFTIPKDITQWSNVASQFKDSWDVIKNLDPNIDMAASAKFLTLDSEGNKKNPMEIANSVKKLNQAWANLSSKDKDVKKKAQIDIAVAYAGNIVKEGQTPEEVSKAALERLRSKFKNFDKLPPIKQTQLIQSEIDYQVINLDNAAKIATLQAQATELMKGAMTEGKARMLGSINQQIATLQGQSNIALEKANAEEVSAMETSTGGGGGGGGGEKANPLLDLKKSILEQIKMYVDMTATMKDLNSKKLSFADIILKGQGIFDKLKAIKGVGGGLGSAAREAIMGMGPDAAKKWIEKNTRKNKKGQTVLTKEGQLESDRLEALSIKGTITENVTAFESSRAQKRAYSNLRGKGLSESVIQSIGGDPKKAAELEFLQKKVNAGVNGSKKAMWAFLDAEKAAVKEAELLARAQDPIQTQIDDMTLAHKFTSAEIDKQIKIYEDQVDVINKEISAIQELNNKDQNRIRDLDRQKEIINRQIEALSRSNELDQQRADTLKRQDEIRNRTADAISHDLDIMSKKESEIQKAYDKRIKALDEVAKINDYILNQQRSQLGLADALSRGDISAAAGIQQEMQAGSAQFATQEMRTGLQTGMENQIAGLTTSGGLTRDQAEAQIASIKEQSYQTSLLIRDIEDAIYNRNLEMIPLRNSQLVIDQQIQVIQDAMYDRESAIIVIQDGKLATAQKQLDKELEIKKALDDRFNAEVLELELKNDQVKMTDIQSTAVNKLAKQYRGVAEQIKNINDLAAKATGNLVEPVAGATETTTDFAKRKKYFDDEKVRLEKERISAIASVTSAIANNPAQIASTAGPAKKINYSMGVPIPFAAGGIAGTGGRDSIPSMLTPGEFVMRKASVQKYGTAMLEKMNMGSFDMPRYSVQEAGGSSPVISTSNNTSINAPVYNTYSVNVNVPNTNADPSMIADKVIMRIGQIDNANIRSLRGNK